jgi:hypothetical protein
MLLNLVLILEAILTFVGDSSYVTPKINESKNFYCLIIYCYFLLMTLLCTLLLCLFSSVINFLGFSCLLYLILDCLIYEVHSFGKGG